MAKAVYSANLKEKEVGKGVFNGDLLDKVKKAVMAFAEAGERVENELKIVRGVARNTKACREASDNRRDACFRKK